MNENRDAIFSEEMRKSVSLYREVKEVILFAENTTESKSVPLSSLNELRNALDHIFRFLLEDESNPEQFYKARGHLYRAGYDAYEEIAIDQAGKIKTLLQSYNAGDIVTVLPDYYPTTRPLLDQCDEELAKERGNKLIDRVTDPAEAFRTYSELVTEIVKIRKKIEHSIPSLQEVKDERVKNEASNTRRDLLIGVAGSIVGAVILLMVQWLLEAL